MVVIKIFLGFGLGLGGVARESCWLEDTDWNLARFGKESDRNRSGGKILAGFGSDSGGNRRGGKMLAGFGRGSGQSRGCWKLLAGFGQESSGDRLL